MTASLSTTPAPSSAQSAVEFGPPPAIGIQTPGVHHVTLRATDLARAKVFYIDRLGFPLLMETPDLILFLAGGTAFGVRGPTTDTDPADIFSPFRVGLDHVALACTNEDELRRVATGLTSAGVENTGVKMDETLKRNYVAFRDPDGIKWELYMADDAAADRRAQLKAVADAYFDGLSSKDLSRIPYAEDVRLRAPLAPGGAETAQVGPAARAFLEGVLPLVGDITTVDYYLNDDLSGIATAALVQIKSPATTLRVVDRFTVDGNGKIIEQENHYDPRGVTNQS
ncbi:MAG TPA: VOC family protein [Gemmatimonadaceae bacterium]|nr:VOC family protein [Gemmatimonadaceae bacterium]